MGISGKRTVGAATTTRTSAVVEFTRRFALGNDYVRVANLDQMKANLSDGVLMVTLPKKPEPTGEDEDKQSVTVPITENPVVIDEQQKPAQEQLDDEMFEDETSTTDVQEAEVIAVEQVDDQNADDNREEETAAADQKSEITVITVNEHDDEDGDFQMVDSAAAKESA